MSKAKTILYAISTLSGTIIGVGLFGLPYVTLQVGFWTILGYFLVLGTLVVLVHLFFGELALKTPDFKRLPGFAKIYLGGWGERTAYISTALGLFGTLLAYLIVGGEFLTELFSPYFGGGNLFYTLLYFVVASTIIFYGIKAVAKVEFFGLILFFAISALIYLRARGLIDVQNLFLFENWKLTMKNLFLPYGVIMFSLWGAALIPEVEEMLAPMPNNGVGVGAKKALKWIIPVSILIPAIVYLFFIYLILGITGINTTESALGGLRAVFGNGIMVLALAFGLLTTFTSFIALGLTLKKVFWYDLGFGKGLAFVVTCFVPLLLFLAGLKSFLAVIGVVGGVMLALDGILILLMYNKIRPDRKWIIYPLILAFLVGMMYSFVYFA